MLFSSCGRGGLPRTSRGVLLWSTTEFRDQGWWRRILMPEKEDRIRIQNLGGTWMVSGPPSSRLLILHSPESSSAWAKDCGAFVLLLTGVDGEPLCGSSCTVISPCEPPAAGFLSPEGRGQAPFGCILWVGRHTLRPIAQHKQICGLFQIQRLKTVQRNTDSTDPKSSGLQNLACGTMESRD